MKEYSSFEEIERDIKILKLQSEIDKEEVLLSFHRTKDALSPASLISSAAQAAKRKAMELKAMAVAVGNQVFNRG
ncbi:hypothetical protein BH23BAC2_BH23BAC2_03320 [soil metagenome]